MTKAFAVVRNVEQDQYEVALGDKKAVLTFKERHGVLSLIHTEVPQEFRGLHIAEALARTALEDARARGLKVKPYCPFVDRYLKRHSEYRDLVDASFA